MRLGFSGALALAFALSAALQGCGGEDGATGPDGSSVVTLSLSGLKPLDDGLNYEVWLIGGTALEPWGSPLVLFDVDQEGRMVDPAADTVLVGPFQGKLDPPDVIGVAISVEATDTLLDYSSFTFVLGGDLAGGSADLSTAHWIALNQSLQGSSGRFVLGTPTDGDQENELSGVWFIDTRVSPVGPGLTLPEATLGWVYEAWVSLDGVDLSTGKFLEPTGADSAATYSGTEDPPPFPGEDFLVRAPAGLAFPPDLSGATVFVTLEPWMEWDVDRDAPFPFRIFEAQIPAEAVPHNVYEMTSLTDQLPSGTATVQGG
jgi:hypothetical protein